MLLLLLGSICIHSIVARFLLVETENKEGKGKDYQLGMDPLFGMCPTIISMCRPNIANDNDDADVDTGYRIPDIIGMDLGIMCPKMMPMCNIVEDDVKAEDDVSNIDDDV